MAKKRDNALRKEQRQAERLSAIRRGLDEAARVIGIGPLVAKLPAHIHKWILTMPVLDAAVIPDAASANHKAAPAVQAELRKRLKTVNVAYDEGPERTASLFFTYGPGLGTCFASMLTLPEFKDLHPIAREGLAKIEAFNTRNLLPTLRAMSMALRIGSAALTRIDREIISVDLQNQQTPSGRKRAVVIFSITDGEQKMVHFSGKKRIVHRIGGPNLPEPAEMYLMGRRRLPQAPHS